MPGYEFIGKEEAAEVKKVFDKSKVLFRHSFQNIRNGVYKVDEFEKNFKEKMNSKYSLAVSSGTAALRVAIASLRLNPGDEIITQSFTFVATVEAIIESRCQPIIADVDATLNMSPKSLEEKISKKTKAIIIVHMLGVPAQMDQLLKIAKKYNLKVIEDTAWGCGGKYKNKFLGTLGDIGTYSFDFAKTMTTGEGGMLLFNNSNIYKKASAWHDHGHENNPKLPRWKDSRSGSGFNYRMMELQGAVGIAQLKKLNMIISKQRKNYNLIKKKLESLPISFRQVPEDSMQTYDALIFYAKNRKQSLDCRNALLKNKISTKILPEAYTWHFAPTWTHMPELKYKFNKCTDSKKYLNRAVSIPINCNMENDFPDKVLNSLVNIFI